jgi:hypothetical protein
VPIASVAKVMTAYVILRDHPLGAGEPGPAIVVQPDEAAAYPAEARNGDSLVPVSAGEQLTERQALEALLLASADNMAWILARWDAGSQAAFTAQMNTTARQLGMTDTHYTDPSGLAASTTSTAADQVRLGMAAMRNPALARIVALRSAVIPVAGMVHNYNTLLGQDGITGLKTGSDTAAGGCVLLAARQQARGHDTLIVAATFGQPGTMATMLPNALQAGRQLVLALGRALAGRSARHIGGEKAETTSQISRHRTGERADSDRDGYLILRGALMPDEAAAFVCGGGYASPLKFQDHSAYLRIISETSGMPLIDVTYDGTVSEEVLHRLREILPDTVAEAVDCPEEPWIGPPGPGDIEIRFRKKSQLDVGDLSLTVEVRTKLFEHRVQDKQRRVDLIRGRLSGLSLGQVGVWLILSEGAWSQS